MPAVFECSTDPWLIPLLCTAPTNNERGKVLLERYLPEVLRALGRFGLIGLGRFGRGGSGEYRRWLGGIVHSATLCWNNRKLKLDAGNRA